MNRKTAAVQHDDTEGHASKRTAKRPKTNVREDKPADTEGHRRKV